MNDSQPAQALPGEGPEPAFPFGSLILMGIQVVVIMAKVSSGHDEAENAVYMLFLVVSVVLYLAMALGKQDWARRVLSFLTMPIGLIVFNTSAAKLYCRAGAPEAEPPLAESVDEPKAETAP